MAADPAPPARSRLGLYLPLILFGALALLFLFRLFTGDPQRLPSALVGKAAPATELPALPGLMRGGVAVPGFRIGGGDGGQVTVLNVFASWCVPCREEHPVLMDLAGALKGKPVRLVGLNYKDKPEAALKFLADLGNPYSAVGVDAGGRAGIDWGVYGVPETFVISAAGTVVDKHVGPLNPEKIKTFLMPAIEKALRLP
ncbi:MAG: DsbE family thiol:disulfide interchange protein [Proteobacteria bacterium]|nr:DsbE family thiol:disulfide interchange protein [Pseudomonadota bacterium]